MRRLQAFALAVIVSAGSAPLGAAQSEVAIRDLTARYRDAWAQHDAAALARLYEPNGVAAGADGTIVSGRAEIERLFGDNFAGLWKNTSLSITIHQIQTLTPEIAVVYGAYNIIGGFAGTTSGRYMLTLVEREGEWLIAGSQTMVPSTPPGGGA